MIKGKNITVFNSIYHPDQPSDFLTILQAIDLVRTGGNHKKTVEKIRAEKDKTKREALKKTLPCICFSGRFPYRAEDKMEKHSSIICLDFDGLDVDIEKAKKKIQSISYVFAAFVSPSGNGLKALIRVPEDCTVKLHREHFLALQEKFALPNFDKKCIDASRICFASYDPDIYVNRDAKIFTGLKAEKSVAHGDLDRLNVDETTEESETWRNLCKWMDKQGETFSEGNMSNFIFKLACAANRFGLSESFTRDNMLYDFPPIDQKKAVDQVASAYRQHKAEHGSQAFKKIKSATRSPRQPSTEEIPEGTPENSYKWVFWEISERKSGIAPIPNKSQFLDFLNENGYFRYRYAPGGYHLVRVVNQIAEIVDVSMIKQFTLSYIQNYPPDILAGTWQLETDDLIRMIADNVTSMYSGDLMDLLPLVEGDFQRDNSNVAFLYYRNTVVCVTPKGPRLMAYDDLPGLIWRTQIIDREFQLDGTEDNDFATYCKKVSFEKEIKYHSLRCIFAYLIHGFKDHAYPRIPILTEANLTANPEGGTGKGIFFQGIEEIVPVVRLDMKDWDSKKNFNFSRVEESTRVVVLDDVDPKFDFADFFSKATEGFVVNRKFVNEVYVKYEDSPKFAINANIPIRGRGNSHKRRRIEFEFAAYYGQKRTPFMEFGRQLFRDWKPSDFEAFDRWVVNSMTHYLSHYVKYREVPETDNTNLELKKFMDLTSPEFAFFAVKELSEAGKYERVALFTTFIREFPDFRDTLTSRTFNKWVAEYAEYGAFHYTKLKSGGQYYHVLVGENAGAKCRPELQEFAENFVKEE